MDHSTKSRPHRHGFRIIAVNDQRGDSRKLLDLIRQPWARTDAST